MLNDQNSSSSLILSAENAALHIQRRYFERDKITRYSSWATSLWTSTRETDSLCEKKKVKIKKKKEEDQTKGKELCTLYILFIHLFIRGEWKWEKGGAIADSRMQRGREIGCCFCATLCASVFIAEISFYRRRSCAAFLPGIRIPFTSRHTNAFRVFVVYFHRCNLFPPLIFTYYLISVLIFLFVIGIFSNTTVVDKN